MRKKRKKRKPNPMNKGTSRHHVVPKSDGGKGLPNNTRRLPDPVHNKTHELDQKVDKALVKKDLTYYEMIITAGWKLQR